MRKEISNNSNENGEENNRDIAKWIGTTFETTTDENEDKSDIVTQIKAYVRDMINDIKENNDYSRFEDIMIRYAISNVAYAIKMSDLEKEIEIIKEEILQNDLTPKELSEILLVDYEED